MAGTITRGQRLKEKEIEDELNFVLKQIPAKDISGGNFNVKKATDKADLFEYDLTTGTHEELGRLVYTLIKRLGMTNIINISKKMK